MEIKYDTTTEITSIDTNSADYILANLAGAYFRKTEIANEPDIFVAIPYESLNLIIDDANTDRAPLHIIASTPEEIVTEITSRHPSKIPGLSRVLEVRNIQLSSVADDSKQRRWAYRGIRAYKMVTFKLGWVLLDYPLLNRGTEIDKIEDLVKLCKQHGAVMVHSDTAKALLGDISQGFTATAEAAGFVVTHDEKLDLYRFNYNPRAFAWRDYRAALKIYQTRMADDFPAGVRYELYRLLSPHNNSHPFKDVLRGKEIIKTRGWGHTSRNDFSTSEIVRLLDLNNQMKVKHWYRDTSTGGLYEKNFTDFNACIMTAVNHLHGVEAFIKKELQKATDRQHECYVNYCQRFAEYLATSPAMREDAQKEHPLFGDRLVPVTLAEYAEKHYQVARQGQVKQLDRLCRFIRREARAAKIKIPRPPKEPAKPGRKETSGKRNKDTGLLPANSGQASDPGQSAEVPDR